MIAVPKALLETLLVTAREVAEMNDAAKRPPAYAEARLLRAVEAMDEALRHNDSITVEVPVRIPEVP